MCGGGEGGIREVEKDYGRGIHSFYEMGRREFYERGKLGGLESEIYSGVYSAPGGLKRFWARRARTSIDVLGLGVLVGRVAGFGVS
jgi:hypothetical protein